MYLWSGIAWGTACSFKKLIVFIHIAKAEIDDFESLIEVQEEILRLQVPVADPALMYVLNA